ncbi:MAG: DUF4179 domain-containing protein [Porcipelethomonas sp.]
MKEIRNNNADVPEIVNEKCYQAYEKIRNEACVRNRKKISKKTVAIACAAAVAACAAIPAAATFIPSVKNVFEITSKTYSKDPANENDLTAFAEPVGISQASDIADITVSEVYYDGEDLAFTSVLTTNEQQLRTCPAITAIGKIFINGNELENENLYFGKNEDGNYYAVTNTNVSEYGISGDVEIEIKIFGLMGGNGKLMIYNRSSQAYEPYETEIYPNSATLNFSASPDSSSEIKTYEVNETQENVTLNSITVSPFKTKIDITGLDDKQSFRVKDSNGIEYEFFGHMMDAEAPLNNAESLTIEVFRLDVDDFPTEFSFTVPIEKGYRIPVNNEYKNREITFIPPESEIESEIESKFERNYQKAKELVAENAKILEIGEVYHDAEITECSNGAIPECSIGAIDIKVNKSEIISDYSEYGTRFEEFQDDIENPVMLLIEYEMTNPKNISTTINFCGFQILSDDFEDVGYYEYDYADVKDHGGKYSYNYDFKPNETKTITLGHILSEEEAQKALYIVPGHQSSTTTLAYYVEEGGVKYHLIDYTLMKIK